MQVGTDSNEIFQNINEKKVTIVELLTHIRTDVLSSFQLLFLRLHIIYYIQYKLFIMVLRMSLFLCLTALDMSYN